MKAAGRGSSVTAGHSQATSLVASGVTFPRAPPFSAGDMLGDPLEMLGCESHPCLAFVSSEAGTVTAGHIPAGTGPPCDPADGDGSAKAPSGKALLQAGEF